MRKNHMKEKNIGNEISNRIGFNKRCKERLFEFRMPENFTEFCGLWSFYKDYVRGRLKMTSNF